MQGQTRRWCWSSPRWKYQSTESGEESTTPATGLFGLGLRPSWFPCSAGLGLFTYSSSSSSSASFAFDQISCLQRPSGAHGWQRDNGPISLASVEGRGGAGRREKRKTQAERTVLQGWRRVGSKKRRRPLLLMLHGPDDDALSSSSSSPFWARPVSSGIPARDVHQSNRVEETRYPAWANKRDGGEWTIQKRRN